MCVLNIGKGESISLIMPKSSPLSPLITLDMLFALFIPSVKIDQSLADYSFVIILSDHNFTHIQCWPFEQKHNTNVLYNCCITIQLYGELYRNNCSLIAKHKINNARNKPRCIYKTLRNKNQMMRRLESNRTIVLLYNFMVNYTEIIVR